jgi:hypothetical protein
MREGRPLNPKSEIVRLTPRKESPVMFDVHVEHEVGEAQPARQASAGPPQVATKEYRESWERTFGAPAKVRTLN